MSEESTANSSACMLDRTKKIASLNEESLLLYCLKIKGLFLNNKIIKF